MLVLGGDINSYDLGCKRLIDYFMHQHFSLYFADVEIAFHEAWPEVKKYYSSWFAVNILYTYFVRIFPLDLGAVYVV